MKSSCGEKMCDVTSTSNRKKKERRHDNATIMIEKICKNYNFGIDVVTEKMKIL